jgi:YrbI family 3-deoxy-D-manno-octulosonate 8-phosphate phosphatase
MIKLIVFDFDGVFTDGKIIFDNDGNALKHYNAKDGMGIFELHRDKIEVGVISGWPYNNSQNSILEHLQIKRVSLGSNNKLQILQKWCNELNIELDNVAYMGDDINDLEVIKEVGLTGCPNDAVEEVKSIVDFISSKNGGNGAIREFCDHIKKTLNKRDNMYLIPIYEPKIKQYSNSAIDAIQSGWISNYGKYVKLAENKLNYYLKNKYSILMANGTCATHCLFLATKFKYPNINKIYVPNNAYIAAWNSCLNEYDIDKIEVMKMNNDTWNINTNEEYIKSLDNNSLVLIVHNLGNIINVPLLKRIRPDLIFVEDNCEGMFGKYEDIFSGISESSLCSSCSFYGNKIITTGEGGAFFTQDKEVYNYIKSIYSQGMSETRYLHNLHAYNYRMTNIQAGFLYEQLNDIDKILENKYKIFKNYDNLLQDLVKLKKIKLIKCENNTINSPWIYALRIVDNKKSIEETLDFFKKNNIDVRPFFYPINSHEHLKFITNNDDTSYSMNKEIIMIPSSPTITYEEQKTVINNIYKFI